MKRLLIAGVAVVAAVTACGGVSETTETTRTSEVAVAAEALTTTSTLAIEASTSTSKPAPPTSTTNPPTSTTEAATTTTAPPTTTTKVVAPISFAGEGDSVETFDISAGTYIAAWDATSSGYAAGTLKSFSGGCEVAGLGGEDDIWLLTKDETGETIIEVSVGGLCILEVQGSDRWAVEFTRISG